MLLRGDALVKTIKFRKPSYVGDPVNALRIFNDLGADEVIIADIGVAQGSGPRTAMLREIASEAFMPLCYAGGIGSVEHAQDVFRAGFEKVAVNRANVSEDLLSALVKEFGSQSVVGAMDVVRKRDGLTRHLPRRGQRPDAVHEARRLLASGVGELFVQWRDLDGTRAGYDVAGIQRISDAVNVPVIACGGAGTEEDLESALSAGAAAAAAGSLFVHNGPRRGVLIGYPKPDTMQRIRSSTPAK